MRAILALLGLSVLSLLLVVDLTWHSIRRNQLDLTAAGVDDLEDDFHWLDHPLTEPVHYDPLPRQLLQPHKSKFCGNKREIVLIAVYTQSTRPLERRLARQFYKNVTGDSARPIFPVGRTTFQDFDLALIEEQRVFGDILLGDFEEAYEFLPTKTSMLLQFFSEECQDIPFLFKHDLDVIVNYPRLKSFLENAWDLAATIDLEAVKQRETWDPSASPAAHTNEPWLDGRKPLRDITHKIIDPTEDPLWMGWVWEKESQSVIHNSTVKNYEVEYPDREYFPRYAAGPAMIYNHAFASKFLEQRSGPQNHYIRNEDAMVGLVMEGHVSPLDNKQMIPFIEREWLHKSCGPDCNSLADCSCDRWLTYHVGALNTDWFLLREKMTKCNRFASEYRVDLSPPTAKLNRLPASRHPRHPRTPEDLVTPPGNSIQPG